MSKSPKISNPKTSKSPKTSIPNFSEANSTSGASTTPKSSSKTPLLACHNLSKSYGKTSVLKNINLEIPAGKIVGLLGANGAGKTTFIKLCNDLLVPSSGEILINGEPIGVASKRLISYLPERTYLDKTLRIRDAVQLFSDFYDNFNTNKAYRLIQDLNLNPETKILHMSKGMQEKLQLILVMSRHAKLYILDEPLGGIDPATRDYILDTILTNFDDGASLLISTHLISDIEHILDEVIFLKDGEIILTDSADHLRDQHHSSIDHIFRTLFKANSKQEN